MSKHIVVFKGGFSNQLFQYIIYYQLCQKYGFDNVFADISEYSSIYRTKTLTYQGGFRFFDKVQLLDAQKIKKNKVLINENNYFDIFKINKMADYIYDGFWQDDRFIPDNIEFIDYLFNKKNLTSYQKELLNKIKETNSVSIHIRKGDYVNNFVHGMIANLQYINNAIEYININVKNPNYFVFSDDIEWCKQNISISNATFIQPDINKVQNEIYLMSCCKHNIISNSSYSWWAQRINNNKNKIVITPEYWFNEKIENNTLLDIVDSVKIPNIYKHDSKSKNPFFSIVVPCYNVEIQVKRLLATVLNQTYKNFELILIDDKSTDNTMNVLEHYANIDKRISIVKNEINKGTLSSTLIGFSKCKGQYALRFDPDDYIELDTLKILHDSLKNKETDLLEFSYREIPERLDIETEKCEGDLVKGVLYNELSHSIWNKCYSSKLINKVSQQAKDFRCVLGEDRYLMFIIANNCTSYRIIKDVLYNYVIYTGITNRSLESIRELKTMICNLDISYNESREYLKEYRHNLVKEMKKIIDDDSQMLRRICASKSVKPLNRLKLLLYLDCHYKKTYFCTYLIMVIKNKTKDFIRKVNRKLKKCLA